MTFALILSPAKKMNVVEDPPLPTAEPVFLERTQLLADALAALSYEDAKALWQCSDALARPNWERHQHLDLHARTSAAVTTYEGIAYQHLAASIMDAHEVAYLERHLRIISGFYGVLRPLDGVVPYRLEMQAKLAVAGSRDLYEFWGNSLANELSREFDALVNVASVEYAKAVLPHARQLGMRVVTCLFGSVRADGRFIQRATEAKAARGTFVRWCAERGVESTDELKGFRERGYVLDEGRSCEDELVFVR